MVGVWRWLFPAVSMGALVRWSFEMGCVIGMPF